MLDSLQAPIGDTAALRRIAEERLRAQPRVGTPLIDFYATAALYPPIGAECVRALAAHLPADAYKRLVFLFVRFLVQSLPYAPGLHPFAVHQPGRPNTAYAAAANAEEAGQGASAPVVTAARESSPLYDASETLLQEWFNHLMFGANATAIMAKIADLNERSGSGVCGAVLTPGEPAYYCRTCGADPSCIQCMRCFRDSDHTGHETVMAHAGGGCCDCGSLSAWALGGCCSKHKGPQSACPPMEILSKVVPESQVRMLVFPVLAAVAHAAATALSPTPNKAPTPRDDPKLLPTHVAHWYRHRVLPWGALSAVTAPSETLRERAPRHALVVPRADLANMARRAVGDVGYAATMQGYERFQAQGRKPGAAASPAVSGAEDSFGFVAASSTRSVVCLEDIAAPRDLRATAMKLRAAAAKPAAKGTFAPLLLLPSASVSSPAIASASAHDSASSAASAVSSTATSASPVVPRALLSPSFAQSSPLYIMVLHDTDSHTYDQIEAALTADVALLGATARDIATQVDLRGWAVLLLSRDKDHVLAVQRALAARTVLSTVYLQGHAVRTPVSEFDDACAALLRRHP